MSFSDLGIGMGPTFGQGAGGLYASSSLDINFSTNIAKNSLSGFYGSPDNLLTYTSPSPKMVYSSTGVLCYAPHNLALYSGTLTDVSWSKTNSSYSGGKLVENGSAGLHAISRTVSVSAGRLIVSARVKADTRSAGRLFVGNTNGFQVNFDLSVPSVSGGAGVGTGVYESAGVISLGNGEYRVWVAGNSADASSVVYVYLNNGVSVSYTGDGASGMFVNEVQVEFSRQSLPGTYLETTSAARYSLPIDYDPLTRVPLGVLIEEQRTNFLTYSEQFDNAVWTKDELTVTADAASAPDGTTTAEKLIPTVVSATTHRARQAYTFSTVNSYSVFVQSAGYTWVKVRISNLWGNVNLSTGTIGFTHGSATVSVTNCGNGWWHIILVGTPTAGAGYAYVYPMSSNENSADPSAWTGDGTSGIYVWGAQLEAGSCATSYIPTIASQVTRAADNISLATTAFSFNAAEGTVSAAADVPNISTSNLGVFALGTSASVIMRYFRQTDAQPVFQVVDTTTQATIGLGATWSSSASVKSAMAYQVNNFAASKNGGTPVTDTSGTVPAVAASLVFGNAAGIGYLNGHISRLTYWNTRKTNSELQVLST